MPTLAWIVVSGVLMSSLALAGGVTLALRERTFRRLVLPLVALAAGALLGGALFHLLPRSIERLGNTPVVYGWLAAGLVSFFLLEQYLHWHHCHRSLAAHRPVGSMILLADGLHNMIGGLAVGSAFVVDTRLGIITWLVTAGHEIPQEFGDFGILVHSGWEPYRALGYNLLSALPFLVGGVVAYALAGRVDVTYLVPFAAGNFLYIAVADLLPEVAASEGAREKVVHAAAFACGMATLYVVATVAA